MIKPNGYCGSYPGKMDCAQAKSQGPEAGGDDFCAGNRSMNITTTGRPWLEMSALKPFSAKPTLLVAPQKTSLLYDGLCKFTRLL
jgi:hypothetical protein